MGRYGRWLLIGWLSALCPLGAQEAPPPDDPGMVMPGEPGAEGQPQAPQKVRQVFVAPFINDGGPALAFWAEGLTVIFAEEAQAKFAVTRVDVDPPLHADFVTGKLRATNDGDLRRALDRAGGDTILVTRYSGEATKFKLSGEAFEGNAPGEPFAKVEITGQTPYVAVRQYLEAWAPKLGAPQPAAGGATSGAESGMEGAPATEGMSQMPGEGGPAISNEGPTAMEGMGAEMGMAAPPPPTVKVVDYKVEHYCRGMAAWPMLDPGYTWLGDISAAITAFEKQLVDEPSFGLGYTAAALAQVAAGRINRGVEIQRAWNAAVEPSPAEFRNLGRVLEAAGRPDEALNAYRQAVTAEGGPLAPDVLAVSRLELVAGRPQEAVTALDGGIAKLPTQRVLRLALGKAQLAAGNAKAAVEAYTEAVRMDAKALDGYLGLADAYLLQRYGSKAVDTAKMATTQLPQAPTAWVKLAEAQLASGRAPQALAAAQQAVTVAGNEAEPYQALGEVQLAAGQFDQAAASFREAVQRDQAWNKPRRYLARAMLYAGQTEQAGTLLQEALVRATVADMPATCRDAARVAFYAGDLTKTMTMLQLAEDYAPREPETALLRSLARLYLGDQEGAWGEFAACLDRLDGTLTDEALSVLESGSQNAALAAGHVMAGFLYERLGNTDKAREHYRKYRVAQPKGFLMDIVKERLDATERRP